MARIAGVDPAQAEGPAKALFEAQTKKWGAPLGPHLVHARNPVVYRAIAGMWAALGSSKTVGAALIALLNRRVAALNGCEF